MNLHHIATIALAHAVSDALDNDPTWPSDLDYLWDLPAAQIGVLKAIAGIPESEAANNCVKRFLAANPRGRMCKLQWANAVLRRAERMTGITLSEGACPVCLREPALSDRAFNAGARK